MGSAYKVSLERRAEVWSNPNHSSASISSHCWTKIIFPFLLQKKREHSHLRMSPNFWSFLNLRFQNFPSPHGFLGLPAQTKHGNMKIYLPEKKSGFFVITYFASVPWSLLQKDTISQEPCQMWVSFTFSPQDWNLFSSTLSIHLAYLVFPY